MRCDMDKIDLREETVNRIDGTYEFVTYTHQTLMTIREVFTMVAILWLGKGGLMQ
ncbi:hypothetical protein JFJ05_13705, partial [Enterococcus faecium]|nr:hypothetical protein [Enterococcus faecium]